MVDYLHPSVSSRIIDNSTVFVTAQGLTTLFAAFAAPQGPDNVIQAVTSPSQLYFYYGYPDLANWGQTLYNVSNWLEAGGQALCMRVLPYRGGPSDWQAGGPNPIPSLYATLIVGAGISSVTSGGSTTLYLQTGVRALGAGGAPYGVNAWETGTQNGVVEIGANDTAESTFARLDSDFRGYTIEDIPVGDVANVLNGTTATTVATPYWIPLMVVRGIYRGQELNSLSVRMDLLTSLDNTFSFRTYQFTVFNGGAAVESFIVSTYPGALDKSQNSLFIEDVVNTNSAYVRVLFNQDNYDQLCNFINASSATNSLVQQSLDIFTLQEQAITPAPTTNAGVTLVNGNNTLTGSAADAVLDPSTGLGQPLTNGSDGVWANQNALDVLLTDAYSGTGDAVDSNGYNLYGTYFGAVLDKNQSVIDVLLDANYDASVKTGGLQALAMNRGDCMAFLDVGFTATPAQAQMARTQPGGKVNGINTFYVAIWCQDFTTYDNFNGNYIRVTPTYYLASLVPYVDNNYGIHWPFVGPRRGTISGFSAITWIPDEPTKEVLYNMQLNYAETTPQQTAFMSQKTSQLENSALSDISHVRALLRIRRDLEAMAKGYRFEFNDKTTWGQLQYSATQYLNTWVANRALTSGTVTVYASPYDQQQRILRMKVSVVFTGIIERVAIDIVVNR